MLWRTRMDNGNLQWQTFLAGWFFVSFLDRLAGSLLGFLQMLRALCLGRPCSSWNLWQTFHDALGNLEDQTDVAWADTTEYKGVILFAKYAVFPSLLFILNGKCFCCIWSFFVAFFAKSSCFTLWDLSALDEFLVLHYGYFAVILFEVSLEGSYIT